MDTLKLLNNCRQVVAIGGGHGLGKMMASLSFMEKRLTGIVATTDDGGSTGRLREASGCIAWGDLRNCLNQLCSDRPNLPRLLFEYRFQDSGDLSDHNLGNLMLLAMDSMCVRPLDAVNLIREMLHVKAFLVPMSESPTKLLAVFEGQNIVGETRIDSLPHLPEYLCLSPEIEPTKEAVDVIKEAELIVLGPGSFMTSILPALLLEEIAQAVINSKALKVFVGNIHPEKSPAGSQSVAKKLLWMKKMTGVYPDVLLWPSEAKSPSNLGCDLYMHPLADSFQLGVHCCDAIRIALERILCNFHEK